MLSEIRIAKDFFIMFISSWLLILVTVYSWKEEITHQKLLLMFLWSIIAWYLVLWPIEYLFPVLYNHDKLHDFAVAVTTLSAFQLLVIAHKKDLLLKIYNNKVKKYD
jgi:hypothetical protein